MTSYIEFLSQAVLVYAMPVVAVGFLAGHAIKFFNPKTELTPSGIAVASLVAMNVLALSFLTINLPHLENRAWSQFISIPMSLSVLCYSAKPLSTGSQHVKILAILQAAIPLHAFIVIMYLCE